MIICKSISYHLTAFFTTVSTSLYLPNIFSQFYPYRLSRISPLVPQLLIHTKEYIRNSPMTSKAPTKDTDRLSSQSAKSKRPAPKDDQELNPPSLLTPDAPPTELDSIDPSELTDLPEQSHVKNACTDITYLLNSFIHPIVESPS